MSSRVSSGRLIVNSLVYRPADMNGQGSQILRRKSLDWKYSNVRTCDKPAQRMRHTSPERCLDIARACNTGLNDTQKCQVWVMLEARLSTDWNPVIYAGEWEWPTDQN